MEFINKYNYIILLFLSIGMISCNDEDSPDCFKKAGDNVSITRETGEFFGIQYLEFIKTTIVQDTVCFLEIKGPENILNKISTKNENGILLIENLNTCDFVRNMSRRPHLYIHVCNLRELYIHDGAGDIDTEGVLRGDSLFVECKHGNGPVSLNLDYRVGVFQFHTGACDLQLSGNVDKAELYNNGYGRMDAGGLIAKSVFLNNSSINDVYVYADEYLYVGIYGSGDVYYRGMVQSVDLTRTGSGTLINIE